MTTCYEQFLRMLDFTDEECKELLPQWIHACRLFGLTESDLCFATEQWIPAYWDLSLHGVRRCIGAFIREFITISRLEEFKAKGDKLVYFNMPSHPACAYANKISGGEGIHTASPDFIISSVLNAFFHKNTVLEDKTASCMNPMCNHCGMNRLRADAHHQNMVAVPDVMWNWGLFCNESPKTEELIECTGPDGWEYVLTFLPHDVNFGVHEVDDPDRARYLAEQLRSSQEQVSRITGVAVTDQNMKEAIEAYMSYIHKLDELTMLVATSDPQPISGNDLTIFSVLAHAAFDTGFRYFNEAIDEVLVEVRERIERHDGALAAGAPKLACHFVPYCVPWVSKAFSENGVNLTINTMFASASAMENVIDSTDVFTTIARQWLCNPSAVNLGDEAFMMSRLLSCVPVDGVLFGFFSFDRWLGGLQKTMIKLVEQQSGVPGYYLEGDFWTDEKYSLEDRLSRIESIAYKIKINHMINGWKNVQNKNT